MKNSEFSNNKSSLSKTYPLCQSLIQMFLSHKTSLMKYLSTISRTNQLIIFMKIKPISCKILDNKKQVISMFKNLTLLSIKVIKRQFSVNKSHTNTFNQIFTVKKPLKYNKNKFTYSRVMHFNETKIISLRNLMSI